MAGPASADIRRTPQTTPRQARRGLSPRRLAVSLGRRRSHHHVGDARSEILRLVPDVPALEVGQVAPKHRHAGGWQRIDRRPQGRRSGRRGRACDHSDRSSGGDRIVPERIVVPAAPPAPGGRRRGRRRMRVRTRSRRMRARPRSWSWPWPWPWRMRSWTGFRSWPRMRTWARRARSWAWLGPWPRSRRMELLPAPAFAGPHAREGPAARRVDVAGRPGVGEAASQTRTSQPGKGEGLPGQAGGHQGRHGAAAEPPQVRTVRAHGLTFAMAMGLASLAGVKVKVSAAKRGSVFHISLAS